MSKVYTIAVLVGSLRKESINRKVALALAQLAPANLKLNIVEIGELALYNEDLDGATPPAAYTTFRQQVAAADGVLFVTPEYNRSVPAALKMPLMSARAPTARAPGTESRGGHQCFAGSHWRLRRQSSFAPVPGVSECALHAAAGSLPRRRGQCVR